MSTPAFSKPPVMTAVMDEVWLPAPGHPGYEVSNFGRVRSPRKVLTPYITGNGTGYPTVKINHKNVKVHRLVAFAFLIADIQRQHVNHKNGQKHDNRAENLEWCTNQENMLHSFRELSRVGTGGHHGKRGDLHHASKPVIGRRLADGTTRRWGSTKLAAEELGLRRESIGRAASGYYSHTGGWAFTWERA